MRKTVVFILSSNYSGSHFLSLLIGSHSHAMHLGETRRLASSGSRVASKEEPRFCFVCGSHQECSLFRGIQEVPLEVIYSHLFMRAKSDTSVLVDTSKKTAWAQQFENNPDYRILYIHLVRDPRALVRRWSQSYTDFTDRLKQRKKQLTKRPALAFAPQWKIYTHKWLHQNRKITDFLSTRGRQGYIVSYHDLAASTHSTLAELMQWLGLDFEPGQINYWEHEHHGTQKADYGWINQSNRTFFDLRWQEDIAEEVQQSIATDTDVLAYLDGIGLALHDNGLTRIREEKGTQESKACQP
ncbi:MAG: sulfotransferase [Pseudomonadota bacterium]